MTPVSWDQWQSFLAVAEAGSLSGAARARGLTQPTLSRHVAELEAALGTALFARGPAGMALTVAGEAALPQARAMGHAAGALLRAVEGAGATQGRIRIAASEVVAAEVLPEVLAGFAARNPGITLDVAGRDRAEDLLTREADLAVRMVRPGQAALVARRVAVAGIGLYAAPAYAVREGVPDSEHALAAHCLIGPETAARLGGARFGARPADPGDFAFRSDSDAVQLAMVRAGMGIGACQHGVAARHGLVRVVPEWEIRLDVWLAMHEDQRGNVSLRRLWDHLALSLPGAF